MKKYILFLLLIVLMGLEIVKAETFVEGKYISGEYISKKKDGKIHYLTVQFLNDSNGNIVYCLEPYTKFVEGKSYTSYEGDISGYSDLSDAQKRRISLIVYYGYGYTGRTSNKWYAITQYLIWDTVTGSNGSVYFTDTLNGTKITKYTTEINTIKKDVDNHDLKPEFIKNYDVNYEGNLFIDTLDYEVIKSDFENIRGNGINLSNLKESGKVTVSKQSNYYSRNVAIFDSTSSQDLIRPGNVVNPKYDININVLKGNITLDIKKDDDIYTVESDFSNTCYDIYRDSEVIDSVCTDEDELVYKTVDLPYGDYIVKQASNGLGYLKDNKEYQVSINSSNNKPTVTLYNLLLKNEIRIKKYACKKDDCILENGAVFEVYDSKNNLVNSLITNELGEAKIQLGYGSYRIKQTQGRAGYSMADEYTERIVDEENIHSSEIINNFIELKKEIKVSETPKEVEGEEEVPNTEVKGNWFMQFLAIIFNFMSSIFNKIVN